MAATQLLPVALLADVRTLSCSKPSSNPENCEDSTSGGNVVPAPIVWLENDRSRNKGHVAQPQLNFYGLPTLPWIARKGCTLESSAADHDPRHFAGSGSSESPGEMDSHPS